MSESGKKAYVGDIELPAGTEVSVKPDYEIHFDRSGANIVLTCTEHGVFYNRKKPQNSAGQNNVIWAYGSKHRKEFHGPVQPSRQEAGPADPEA